VRLRNGVLACVLACAGAAGCGGSATNPTPPPPPPPPVNQVPVIESIASDVQRAEVGTDVRFTATVRDPETPVDRLIFEWAADSGTFTGQGASVTWRPADNASTPADFVIRLTVREQYGTAPPGGQRPEHRVTADSSPVRVHNSPKELGDMAMRFLNDFANSSVSADTCIRDFSDSCPGKKTEREQIADNRRDYQILSSSLSLREVSVATDRMSGRVRVDCAFTSRVLACVPGTSVPNCAVGATERVVGDCLLTAIYQQNRWWLCDSTFADGQLLSQPARRGFWSAQ
jgi:hypothetical protein